MGYAVPTELQKLSLPAAALAGIPEADQQVALDAASSLADGYLAAHFKLPLVEWGDDLRRAVCNIAAYDLLTRRGYSPDADGNSTIRDRYDDAIRWLERVASGQINPQGVVDSAAPAGSVAGAFIVQAVAADDEEGGFSVGPPRGRGW